LWSFHTAKTQRGHVAIGLAQQFSSPTRLQFLAQSDSAVAFVGPGDLAWC